MGEEVELEALAEQLVGDVADAALPRRAGIGYYDVAAAEALEGSCKRSPPLLGLGHVALHAKALDVRRGLLGSFAIDVEDRYGGALRGESACRSGADCAGAGDERDLSSERLDHGALELSLFEAPIFKREQVALGQGLVAPDRLGVRDHFDGVLGEVSGNRCVLGGAAEPESADARHHDAPRTRIEVAR